MQRSKGKRQKCWVALLVGTAAFGQVAKEANSGYKTVEGRSGVAATLGASDRDKTQRPRELVAEMGVRPGMTVADVGTGIGYMLPYLSEAVGASGKVLAEDIFDDFLAKAKERAKGLANVSFIKGGEDNPMLPEGAADRILVLDVYHHFDYPEKMLAAFRKALSPDGRLVVVEYYKRPTAMANGRAMTHIRLDAPDVIREIEANHFRLVSQREHTKDSQYMLILEKN
jgi:ubiquinone/menaquinone biosynthesis C-methylase UbiE